MRKEGGEGRERDKEKEGRGERERERKKEVLWETADNEWVLSGLKVGCTVHK